MSDAIDALFRSGNAPTYVIAELSCNHNGSLDEAMAIVHASKDAGADAIKLQCYSADTITRDFKSTLKGSLWEKTDLYQLYQKAHTPKEWQIAIKQEATRIGLDCIASPFDETAVDFITDTLDVPAIKIASFEGVDTKLLEYAAQKERPVILSNGMMSYEELYEAVETLRKHGVEQLALLHCNSGYPAKFEEAHLNTIPVLAQQFGCTIGLSDHTLFHDTEQFASPLAHIAPLEAVRLGARVIEVHVIMDRAASKVMMDKGEGGFDWAFSREPDELARTIASIRDYERDGTLPVYDAIEQEAAQAAHGSVCFEPTKREMISRAGRPSLWAVQDIKRGQAMQFAAQAHQKASGNFDSIRPAGGLHIRFTDAVSRGYASRDIAAGEPLNWEMISFQNNENAV